MPAPAPDLAAHARAVLAGARHGSLGTLDADGAPFVSLVAVVDDGVGRPLFLLSALAEHTKNLRRSPRASLLVAAEVVGSSMDRARLTLSGTVHWLEGDDAAVARARFVAALPEAQVWVGLPDFTAARLELTSLRFVGGFARAATVSIDAYLAG